MSTFPAPVPKPTTAGAPQTAIANTTGAYVNIRNGPGTNYRDIGDLRNFTLVAHFPGSRTSSGWVWVEQYGVGGWVSTQVVRFEAVSGTPPVSGQTQTPYDNKVAGWHWKGDSVQENTIDEFARNLRRNASNMTMVFVKTSDYGQTVGAQWQGYWDNKRALAIDGPTSIDRWVTALGQVGLEFHAWCVPIGKDVNAEANLIIQACQRPGVRSMILDVEPFEGYWEGGQAAIRPFMTRIRRALPGNFHIGMAVDPRAHHYDTIFPREWQPFVNSIHPMVYWRTMRRPVDELLRETYEVWSGYGKPIIPILQADGDAQDIDTAITLSVNRHNARSVSWWRLGVISPGQYAALNKPIQPGTVQPPPPDVTYTNEVIIKPDDPGFATFSYTGQNELQSFQGTWGWRVYYKATEAQASKTSVRWAIPIREDGRYEISVFVPGRHSSTRNARYKIHGVRGSSGELSVTVDQSQYSNQWVTLGVFDIERAAINAGTVFLNDLTGEAGREIAFDAMRWRQAVTSGTGSGPFADGFDSPVGTQEERRGTTVWPGRWYDASPFGRLYFVGTPQEAYHTGADLNLPQDADRLAPVFSPASGIVTFAGRLPVWGNVIIIKHDPLQTTRMTVYSRFGHVDTMGVAAGARVSRGQQIGTVGNAFGRYAFHLHFDISPTNILESNPQHWPGRTYDALSKNYVDPKEFILSNRPR